MYSPVTGKKMPLLSEKRTYKYGKDEVEVDHLFYLCEETGDHFTDFILDIENMERKHDQYRKTMNPLV